MYNSEQKNHLSKSTYSALTVLFYVVLSLPVPSNAQTGCSRADIDHYLEKGFTPAQITSICADTGLQDLKPQGKETIKKLIATGNEELLPIRQGTPRDRVEAELRKVIR